ncbi:MAG TPA: oligosaccharide flippase family protein [Flavobacteriaceae bacterium]|nr:oligosaccharide flippase family protein [Flavobacteriaceae bacterium]
MPAFQRLFKQTFIYGLATVLPRMFSFLLLPLYTKMLPKAEYGEISVVFAYFIVFNIILAYGMETAFFRFYSQKENKEKVMTTSGWSLVFSSSLFFVLAFFGKNYIANLTQIPVEFITLIIWILFLDALVIIPFAYLRACEKPIRYAVYKILNVLINLLLNVVFLVYLKNWAIKNEFFAQIYIPDFEINYVFIANLVASAITLLLLLPFYFKLKLAFDTVLWKKMMRYAFPVLIAGVAFSINAAFDKILLNYLLPENIAEAQIGEYAACYKLAIFMTLFATAFRLGIEPFFFSHASSKNAKETYAAITKYFVIFGAIIFVSVIVFIDFLKELVLQDKSYWEAMSIVPLVLLANLCLGIYHNLSVWYKITDRTKFGAYISVFGAIVTIVLNFALIPVWGYFGSAVALLAAYASMVILSYYFGQKHYPIPYNLKKILGYLGISIGICVLSFYFFRGNYFLGILMLTGFMTIVYFSEKEEFKKIINL